MYELLVCKYSICLLLFFHRILSIEICIWTQQFNFGLYIERFSYIIFAFKYRCCCLVYIILYIYIWMLELRNVVGRKWVCGWVREGRSGWKRACAPLQSFPLCRPLLSLCIVFVQLFPNRFWTMLHRHYTEVLCYAAAAWRWRALLATGSIEFNVIMFLKVCAYVDLYVCVCVCDKQGNISKEWM